VLVGSSVLLQNSPWELFRADDRRFRIILGTILVLFLGLGIIMHYIEIPELTREEVETVPPRLATILLERKQQRLQPKPAEAIKSAPAEDEKVKPEPEKKPDVIPEKQPKQVKKPSEARKKIRDKVSKVGLLAMQSELTALADTSVLDIIKKRDSKLIKKATSKTGQSQLAMAKNVAKGSGGIDTSKLAEKNVNIALAARKLTSVQSKIEISGDESSNGESRAASRSIETMQFAIDGVKSSFDFIYNKALRKNPTLRGEVLFELIVAPSGKVIKCRILSSELNDPALERRLVIKMKSINFGAENVPQIVIKYPFEFFPS